MRLILYLDEPLVAGAMRFVFNQTEDISVEAMLDDVDQIIPEVKRLQPDVLLLSVTPALHLGVLLGLREVASECRTVLWTHSIAQEVAHQAMELGVRGVLSRTCTAEMALKCLRKVYQGEMWFERELTSSYIRSHRIPLTPRQAQLVQMVAEGLRNKEIASALSISEGTVKVYLSRLFEKVGARDRFTLAQLGLRNLQSADHAGNFRGAGDSKLRALYVGASTSTR